MIVWLGKLRKVLVRLLKTRRRYVTMEWAEERPLWAEVQEVDWRDIRRMFRVVRDHHIWIEKLNKSTILAITPTKQRD